MTNKNTFQKAKVKNLKEFHDAHKALEYLKTLYQAQLNLTKTSFNELINNDVENPAQTNLGVYPFLGMSVPPQNINIDARLSFGSVSESGLYGTTLTRPDLFADYYREQISLLMKQHQLPVYVGESNLPIPLPFALKQDYTGANDPEQLWLVQKNFVMPNLSSIDDALPNATDIPGDIRPLTLFSAERVDLSLHRLHHYTGTSIEHFQRFILLTNYQRYVDAFLEFGINQLKTTNTYEALVEPGDYIHQSSKLAHVKTQGEKTQHLPQMPAYHLTRPDKNGISFINIGVGPSNAKTITDHLAVLRPHCWIMLGHCAGLRRSQLLGDYVLAHAYVRADHVLDDDLPSWIPIPPIAEVQVALQKAIAKVTGQYGHELKNRMRTGTVFTTDNRNWELRFRELFTQFQQSRAMAVDMESATVAANGFRFRVPYATLLCVSDKPIHGEVKLRGMANAFYQQRVSQHLMIGLETLSILREEGPDSLHSRKLRGFDDPPFR